MTFKEFLSEARRVDSAWVILMHQDQVVLGKRSEAVNNPNQWNFFGGHIDQGESAKQAAARELEEETTYRINTSDLKEVDRIGTAVYFIARVKDLRSIKTSRETAKIKAFVKGELPENLHSKTQAFLNKNKLP